MIVKKIIRMKLKKIKKKNKKNRENGKIGGGGAIEREKIKLHCFI
jgi:3-methyladenine DNA glycosylase AlkD